MYDSSKKKKDAISQEMIMLSHHICLVKTLRLCQKKWNIKCATWLRKSNNHEKKCADYVRAKNDQSNTIKENHAKSETNK